MSLKLVIALLVGVVAAANAAELQCKYIFNTFPEPDYECDGTTLITRDDNSINNVLGTHIAGKLNEDVRTVILKNVTLEILPWNLSTWFKNIRGFAIYTISGYPGFQRKDFGNYRQIDTFYTANLSQVEVIPRDAFYELTNLTHLYLDRMPNMRNLDAGLLVNMPRLRVFSARGPNKVNTIYSNFFAEQSETLQVVDFRGVNLLTIGDDTFTNILNLEIGRFKRAGCLDNLYTHSEVRQRLNEDIRKKCRNGNQNKILKKEWLQPIASSSSSSSEASSE